MTAVGANRGSGPKSSALPSPRAERGDAGGHRRDPRRGRGRGRRERRATSSARSGGRSTASSPFYVGFVGGARRRRARSRSRTSSSRPARSSCCSALAFFIAVGLEPAVRWLYRRGLPRWAGGGARPARRARHLRRLPRARDPGDRHPGARPRQRAAALPAELNHNTSTLGHLNTRYHIVAALQKLLRGGGASFGTRARRRQGRARTRRLGRGRRDRDGLPAGRPAARAARHLPARAEVAPRADGAADR